MMRFDYWKIFGAAFFLVMVFTPMIRWIASRMGAIDQPSAIKIHKTPIPRLGGVAIFMGFFLSLILTQSLTPKQEGVLFGAVFALIVGILDDIRSVPAMLKLLALCLITFFLSTKGVLLDLMPPGYGLNYLLTLLWIVGVTSAMNAIDHSDGLASGLTVIASLAYLWVAIQHGQWAWGALAVALVGSSLGFLLFNFPPASIFMGDSGSFFLGYTLAVISVMGEWSKNPFKAAIVPIFILGLPIFDLIFVVLKRRMTGITKSLREIVTFSAKDHFSHRLLALGMSKKQALFFSYGVMIVLGMGAVAIQYVQKFEAVMLCVQFFLTFLLIVFLVEHALKNKKTHFHD